MVSKTSQFFINNSFTYVLVVVTAGIRWKKNEVRALTNQISGIRARDSASDAIIVSGSEASW